MDALTVRESIDKPYGHRTGAPEKGSSNMGEAVWLGIAAQVA